MQWTIFGNFQNVPRPSMLHSSRKSPVKWSLTGFQVAWCWCCSICLIMFMLSHHHLLIVLTQVDNYSVIHRSVYCNIHRWFQADLSVAQLVGYPSLRFKRLSIAQLHIWESCDLEYLHFVTPLLPYPLMTHRQHP